METDEPPPKSKFEKITLDNGEELTPGEAFSRLIFNKKPRLLNILRKYIQPQESLTSKEINELEEKLEQIGKERYQSGQIVTISENPYLYKTPEFKRYLSGKQHQ